MLTLTFGLVVGTGIGAFFHAPILKLCRVMRAVVDEATR